MGCSKNCSKREVYRNTCLPQETKKKNRAQCQQKEGNNKDQKEINRNLKKNLKISIKPRAVP